MESESKPSGRDDSRSPDSSSDSDSDSDSDTGVGQASNSDSQANPEPEIKWLATTRERRSTAGNRMKSMLANEEPDSDLELLFAEDENDQGFTDVDDDGSDVHMDSSSEDEDNNNNADDDLEGEKELEKQAKERQAAQRKRKAQEAIPAKFRKKVRIGTTTPVTAPPTPAPKPTPRPKKKSERTSWLPSAADLPTRASSRSTTRWSKEQLHNQMVEREAKRLKQLAQMQKKAARLEALKKPPMTQEERLREAAIVEKRNSKSLNRWEEAEKQREEERRARLAALNERTLKGPVITFWSGIGEWMGRNMVVEEPAKKKRERVDKNKDKGKVKDKEKEKEKLKGTEGKAEAKESVKEVGKDDGKDGAKEVGPARDDSITKPKPESDQPPQQTSLPSPAEAASTSPAAPLPKESDATVPVKVEDMSAKPTDTPAASTEALTTSKTEEPPGLMAMPPPPPPIASGLVTPAPPSSFGLAAPTPPPPTSGLAAPAPAPTPSSASISSQRPAITPSAGLTRALESKPSGVLAAPILAPPPGISVNGAQPMLGFSTSNPMSNVLALPNTSQGPSPPTLSSMAASERLSSSASLATPVPPKPTLAPVLAPAPTSTTTSNPFPPQETHFQLIPEPPSARNNATAPVTPVQPPGPPKPSTGARNAIVFQNFDENAIKDRTVQTQIIFGRKMTKLSKPSPAPLCVITNHPARYRDPKTGLPYYNVFAYREIQRLSRGEHRWSKVLNAWVGSGSIAARGVPERFLNPNFKKVIDEKATGEKGDSDGILVEKKTNVEEAPKTTAGASTTSEAKPQEMKPVESKSAENQPAGDKKPAEDKPAENKPAGPEAPVRTAPDAQALGVKPQTPKTLDVTMTDAGDKAPEASLPEPKPQVDAPVAQPPETSDSTVASKPPPVVAETPAAETTALQQTPNPASTATTATVPTEVAK
ncbi:YL1 nuclear protein-domain-containing protein [Dactylonectria macrodidyma]|uniref:YL1 nuclear protein-domain-containing protein n=1 Tax=Dactylonectria macrodidyma TaxID=307937 RepID=A0A9P9EMW8_9HYPO|nr:YL1 nuclear protein-domain-containing protein [Dactylonectria macrodidyma]